jgi:GT2 family glycosyltransferase
MNNKYICLVVLNYNSENDLIALLKQISQQTDIAFSIIIVDNASNKHSIEIISNWMEEFFLSVVSGDEKEVLSWLHLNPNRPVDLNTVFFVKNTINKGYSAGNNAGIRIAEALNANAVLIVNPDMQITNKKYISILSTILFENPKNTIVASAIRGVDGKHQNPLREATFWEEFFWPRQFFKEVSYIQKIESDIAMRVQKVSGCCMMISMDFLKKNNYLDEGIFLYCEEAILSSQVKNTDGRVIFVPYIDAVHAHIKSNKGNVSKRMLLYIKSRKYYLSKYSGYNVFQVLLLKISYLPLEVYHNINKWL